MKASRGVIAGLLGSAALVCSAASALAQNPQAHGRMIEVPPGAMVLIIPSGSVPVQAMAPAAFGGEFPFPAFPSASAMMHEIDQMMADAQRAFTGPGWLAQNRAIEASMRGMPQAGGAFSSVVVTSFSNGHGTCTQRVTYVGNGTAPKIQQASTGDACAAVGVPAALPAMQTPATPAPHLIQAQDRTRTAPLVYAAAGE